MSKNWYTKNSKKILNSLDDIIDKAEMENYLSVVPNKQTREEIRTIIFDFIKKKKRVIYGGTAINFWLCIKDEDKTIYKNLPGDIEFYSPDPLKDTFELCNIFLKKGYKNILGRDAMHINTYKIFVEHTEFCDISLMSDAIIKKNISKEEHNGLLYAKPDFLLTDIFRVFSNPLHDYSFRLKKVFERFLKLRTFYYNPPIKPSTCKITGLDSTLIDIKQMIYDSYIVNNENIILCGSAAYSHYLEESGYLEKDKNAFKPPEFSELVIISEDIKKITLEILNILEENLYEELTIKEYTKFFQFNDKKIDIFYKDRLLISIFGYNETCTQFHKIELEGDNFVQIVGFDYLMMWLNTMLFRNFTNKKEKTIYRCMIYYLFIMQTYYLKTHNLIGIEENHLFTHFLITCKWLTLPPIYRKKESLRKKALKKDRKTPLVFEYRPEVRMVEKLPEKIYTNESGNQIINKKYLMIKDSKYLPTNIVDKNKKED